MQKQRNHSFPRPFLAAGVCHLLKRLDYYKVHGKPAHSTALFPVCETYSRPREAPSVFPPSLPVLSAIQTDCLLAATR